MNETLFGERAFADVLVKGVGSEPILELLGWAQHAPRLTVRQGDLRRKGRRHRDEEEAMSLQQQTLE